MRLHWISTRHSEAHTCTHGRSAGAPRLVHSPKVESKTNYAVPRRDLIGHANIYDSTPSAPKGTLRPTEVPNPTVHAEVASKRPTVPSSAATVDQGDQSVVLVEDSFLDLDGPERISRPPTAYPPQKLTHLSDILGTLLKTVKEIKYH